MSDTIVAPIKIGDTLVEVDDLLGMNHGDELANCHLNVPQEWLDRGYTGTREEYLEWLYKQ